MTKKFINGWEYTKKIASKEIDRYKELRYRKKILVSMFQQMAPYVALERKILDKESPVVDREFAKSVKSKFYFTAVKCARGHISPRYTSNTRCVKCHSMWRG